MDEKLAIAEGKIQELENEIGNLDISLKGAEEDWGSNLENIQNRFESLIQYGQYLRTKEKQLRDEKKLLREKENQLRDEKILLLKRPTSPSVSREEQAFFDNLSTASVDPENFLTLDRGVFWMGKQKKGRKMLVRKCYFELFELVRRINSNNPLRNGFIVTGTPGIGKSFFGYYWLHKGMRENKTVLYEVGRSCFLWKPGHEIVKGTREDFDNVINDRTAWYLIDPDGVRTPADSDPAAFTVMFSSPKKINFHDFEKQGALMLFMPLWEKEELKLCHRKIHMKNREFNQELLDVLVSFYGRIPRRVLEEARAHIEDGTCDEHIPQGKLCRGLSNKLESSLADITLEELRSYFHFSGVEVNRNSGGSISYTLFHIDTKDYIGVQRRWASDHVWSSLEYRYKSEMGKALVEVLRSAENDPELSSLAWHTFEKKGHAIVGSGMDSFEISSLNFPFESMTLPLARITERVIHSRNALSGDFAIMNNVYYRAKEKNQESYDSFMLLDDVKLVLFQFTTSCSHGIKGGGISKVLGHLKSQQRAGAPSIKIYMVFVVPQNIFSSFSYQNHWVEGSKKRRTNFSALEFRENDVLQYKLEISHEMIMGA